MVIINVFKKLRSALMSLTSAGKNGEIVFISVKNSVANWQVSALMNLISGLVRVMLCLREKVFKQICSALRIFVKYTTIARRDIISRINQWFSLRSCVLRFNSVLTSLPPLPFHSLSTPSPLLPSWMCEYHHQAAPIGIAVRPWRVVWVTADNMQSAVPLSLLFSFLAPPAMLRTDCCCFAHREEQPRQQDVRAFFNCSLESKSSAFSSSDPMLPPALRYLRSNDAMSMPCHLLQVCVQGAGVGQKSEPNCSWHFPRHKHASIRMPIIFIETRSSHS